MAGFAALKLHARVKQKAVRIMATFAVRFKISLVVGCLYAHEIPIVIVWHFSNRTRYFFLARLSF